MKNIVIYSTILVVITLGGLNILQAAVQSDSTDVEAAAQILDEDHLNRSIQHHEDLIEKYPEELFIPNIMFELAELYVTKSELGFKRKMNAYDAELAKYENGELLVEPIMPRVSFKESIEVCYKLLEKFPNIDYRDKVLYRLAVNHLDEGNQDRAKEYFQKLIFECPESPKISEANFRLGEYYFNARDFHKAIEYYRKLIDAWDDPFFNMSLYKLGWSYFNVNDYANAISTYMYLIDDITLLEELDTELLGKTKADVKNEAIDYIAHSFCEFGGAAKAREALSKESAQEFAIPILEKMGEIYKKRNFYPEAIATYEVLLELFPFYPYAPNIQKQIIECYENNFEEEKVNEAKETFIKYYGPESEWISQYPEGDVRNDALNLVQDMMFSLGTYYQSIGQEKSRKREYLLAIDKYKEYLKQLKDSDIAHKVNFYLAECYYETGDFKNAAEEYFKVMNNYENDEFKDASAYNRILAYYQLLKLSSQPDSLTFYLENFLGEESTYPIPVRVGYQAQADLLKACNDYIIALPEDDKMLEVYMKYGEVLYDLSEWELAVKVYEKVADDRHKESQFYGTALNMIAQSYFKNGNFREAEVWFEKLAQVFPDSVKYLEKSRKMIASANFKKAEALSKDGRTSKAAAEFLKLAFSTNDKEIARAAIFEAASGFEKDGDMEKAVKCYERMIQEQPDIEFFDELLMKAALLREKMEQWIKAIDHYKMLIQTRPKSQYAQHAVYNSALCYEYLKLWHKASDTYGKYVEMFPQEDPDRTLEALHKRGDIYLTYINDKNIALKEFEKTVAQYERFKSRGIFADEYITAKSQYMIAEINFEKYKNIKLVPPLQSSLKRKQMHLQKVLKAYIATGKFKVADWTTASLYKAGMTFEELCEALLTSPVPSELSREEVEQYYDNIREKLVIPFKKEALKFYKSNIQTAEKNKIENEWTNKSKIRVQALIAELGLGAGRYEESTGYYAKPSSGGGTKE